MATPRRIRRPRPAVLVLIAAAIVAMLAAACLPAAPAPAPTVTASAPTTTTLPNPCNVVTASLASSDGQQLAAVVRHGRDVHVETRVVHSDAEKQKFENDLRASGEVLAISPDSESFHALAETPTWGWTDMNFSNAWSVAPATKGAGIRVAVIDTGVDAAHLDLAGRVVAGKDFVNSALDGTTDCNGHGTHVSGIVAANYGNGVGVAGGAAEATVVAVRVLKANGSGTLSAVAAGILWASDPTQGNAQVISLSLGSATDDPLVKTAVATAIKRGVVVVAAAGNSSGSTPIYPAGDPGVLAVGALCYTGQVSSAPPGSCPTSASTDSYQLATFSNNAPDGVDAPGVDINSTWNDGGYKLESGTSMATPFVSAVAALVRAHCPNDTPAQMITQIESSTVELGAPDKDPIFGYGLVDANAAASTTCLTP